MAELDRESRTLWPQELGDQAPPLDGVRQREVLAGVAPRAEGLGEAARGIPKLVERFHMAEVDRRSFLAQVETLVDQSARLAQAAGAADAQAVRSTFAEIQATCTSCHRRFREFAGPLPTR